MQNPPEESLTLDDPDLLFSIKQFLATELASQKTYHATRENVLEHFPDCKMLSLDQVKRRVTEFSGVTPIIHDMCPNTCLAYVGPWSNLDQCPKCGEDRYDLAKSTHRKKVGRQHFYTIPIGPQLQALWQSPESAEDMRYRRQRTEELLQKLEDNNGNILLYDDIFCGQEYLNMALNGTIDNDDMFLMLSIDGAQLYKNKSSDTWIYIWLVADHSPDLRYKKTHVLCGGLITGPNPPKITDSFLFPGLHHLAAIQNAGLKIWDALNRRTFLSIVWLLMVCADSMGLAQLTGLVGHHGKYGCRIYCPMPSRHKIGLPHYYPACLKPDNYDVAGCSHADIPIKSIGGTSTQEYQENLELVLSARNKAHYDLRQLETGICKPSIFSGLPFILPFPTSFSVDIMHLIALNIPELFVKLWRGSFYCDGEDDKATWDWAVLKGPLWKRHGKAVVDATPYLPGSFDRAPRNPVEKINSGYKAWEYLLYFYGLGPAIFYDALPEKYWKHFCKLVFGVRIICQKAITYDELRACHQALLEFTDEFEVMYCQRKRSRIHFVRPCIHTLCHLAPEAFRVGPGICISQWPMERTIGNLGQEVRQPSNPFMNLSERGLQRSQVNALKAMIPALRPRKDQLPRGSIDLGEGYVLLRAVDKIAWPVLPEEEAAIETYLRNTGRSLGEWEQSVVRWARIRLPNGQIARTAWKEKLKRLGRVRMARMVKVSSSLYCVYSW